MTLTSDIRCKKCGSPLTQQRYCWNEQCEYYNKPQRTGRTRKAKARKASELQRLYLIDESAFTLAYNAAKTRMDWARVEYPSEGEPTFGIAPKLGNVRLSIKPDEMTDLDTYNPEVKQAEIDRVNRDGVWGVIGEYFDGEEWQVADSCWGFVGDDWKSGGYDTDIMRTTLDAARKVAVCECCGRPKRKAVA